MGDARLLLSLMARWGEWRARGVPAELRGVLPEKAHPLRLSVYLFPSDRPLLRDLYACLLPGVRPVRCLLLAALPASVAVVPLCLARVRASGHASLCDVAPHPAVCWWEGVHAAWPWGREVPTCIAKRGGRAQRLVRALTDLDNPCGDAVSAVREMRRFGLEPTYALPFLEGASD